MRQDTNICLGIYLSAARSHIVTHFKMKIKLSNFFLCYAKVCLSWYIRLWYKYVNDEFFFLNSDFLSALLTCSASMRQLVNCCLLFTRASEAERNVRSKESFPSTLFIFLFYFRNLNTIKSYVKEINIM